MDYQATLTYTKAKRPPQCRIELERSAHGPLLIIHNGPRSRESYWLTPLESSGTDGLRFEKLPSLLGIAYDVWHQDGRFVCDCRGFVEHGRCKHAAAAAKLAQDNQVAVTATCQPTRDV